MTTFVKCKICKKIHQTPIQSVQTVDEFIKAKENSEFFENLWKCPSCGRMSMYMSLDYLWHEEKREIQSK